MYMYVVLASTKSKYSFSPYVRVSQLEYLFCGAQQRESNILSRLTQLYMTIH